MSRGNTLQNSDAVPRPRGQAHHRNKNAALRESSSPRKTVAAYPGHKARQHEELVLSVPHKKCSMCNKNNVLHINTTCFAPQTSRRENLPAREIGKRLTHPTKGRSQRNLQPGGASVSRPAKDSSLASFRSAHRCGCLGRGRLNRVRLIFQCLGAPQKSENGRILLWRR